MLLPAQLLALKPVNVLQVRRLICYLYMLGLIKLLRVAVTPSPLPAHFCCPSLSSKGGHFPAQFVTCIQHYCSTSGVATYVIQHYLLFACVAVIPVSPLAYFLSDQAFHDEWSLT